MMGETYADVIKDASNQIALFDDDNDRDRFLRSAIDRIRSANGAEIAAFFIFDAESQELVFRVGIDPKGILERHKITDPEGTLRFSLDQNEAGQAFREDRILKISADEIDENQLFRSKALVPITHGSRRIGVLVLADSRSNAFLKMKDSEILPATNQLGDLLEEASVLIDAEARKKHVATYRTIHGRKAAGGMAKGAALLIWPEPIEAPTSPQTPASVGDELRSFNRALEGTHNQLEFLKNLAATEISEAGAMIFATHILMLKDSDFIQGMRLQIEQGRSAETAVRTVVDSYASRFSNLSEVRLAEKAQDVRDLGNRLAANLNDNNVRADSYHGRIAIARHIYPSELMRLSVAGISGIVLMGTAVTAHIAILSQSLDVPALITEDNSLLDIQNETPLCLDAGIGVLHIDPPASVVEEFALQLEKSPEGPKYLHLNGKTADGVMVQVCANVNIRKDAEMARKQGAEGIGLYRSEFPFILRNDFLSEEQQYQIYRPIVLSHFDKPIILRTADIGGDKILQGRTQTEENPFLGVRGIRFSLAYREMFQDQLRAMLRAGEGADLGIMLPMVSDVEEVIEAKKEIALAIKRLDEIGVPHNSNPRLGAMIELPSAALSAAELASETDFLSIGTNDLTMYLLAVDRTNDKLGHLYKSHHPSVLRILKSIADDTADSEVSVCGGAAADPILMPFFVGIGIRKLSVSPSRVDYAKKRLSQFTEPETRKIAAEMLSIKRVGDMEQYLKDFEIRYPVL